MTAGMLIGLAGLILQSAAEDTTTYGRLLPGFLCFGVALALVYAPMSTAAMAAMPAAKAGIASGVLAMNRVLAGALLLAVAGAVFQSVLPDATRGGELLGVRARAVVAGAPGGRAIAVQAVGTILTWIAGAGAPSSTPAPSRATREARAVPPAPPPIPSSFPEAIARPLRYKWERGGRGRNPGTVQLGGRAAARSPWPGRGRLEPLDRPASSPPTYSRSSTRSSRSSSCSCSGSGCSPTRSSG